jgi:hypothetical protein
MVRLNPNCPAHKAIRRTIRHANLDEWRHEKRMSLAGRASPGRSKAHGMKKKFIWRMKQRLTNTP